jgi:hypothetical protein
MRRYRQAAVTGGRYEKRAAVTGGRYKNNALGQDAPTVCKMRDDGVVDVSPLISRGTLGNRNRWIWVAGWGGRGNTVIFTFGGLKKRGKTPQNQNH